jgi:hypothetical protein
MGWISPTVVAAVPLAALVLGCGGNGASTTPASTIATPATGTTPRSGDRGGSWTRFGYDAARSNAARRGIALAQIARLSENRVTLPGTVDSSPIYLRGVRVDGHRRSVLVVTTTYGRTLGLAPASGAVLWRFTPRSYRSLAGSAQITTATPVADHHRRWVYAASPDGLVHKLHAGNGHEVHNGHWPVSVTRDPSHEKIASALNLSGRYVLVTTGGYIGDAPPYQGKVVALRRGSGRISNVFNSLCSHRRRIIEPASCPARRSAIWGRAGAVVAPGSHRIFVTTGNGPFDGRSRWGDSVLELSPNASRLRRHYTPRNVKALEAADQDLGSTAPALLPSPGGHGRGFLLQGGKDGKLRLLRVPASLSGVGRAAGPRLGGQVQTLTTPGGQDMFTAPAVLHRRRSTWAYVATGGGTAAYRLRHGHLREVWGNDRAGTSPIFAGGLLWVYDPGGGLAVYRATNGALMRVLGAPPGHWNSPIVIAGRAYLPSGDANDHSTSGVLSIYRRR